MSSRPHWKDLPVWAADVNESRLERKIVQVESVEEIDFIPSSNNYLGFWKGYLSNPRRFFSVRQAPMSSCNTGGESARCCRVPRRKVGMVTLETWTLALQHQGMKSSGLRAWHGMAHHAPVEGQVHQPSVTATLACHDASHAPSHPQFL